MEKEIKISELARIWNVSVNATWTRIKKEGLITIKKMDNNREITFVTVSDEILNKYMVNNVNNGVNNGNYEELLTDDNTSQPLASTEIIDKMIKFSNEVQERLITINNEHNEVVNNLNEQLITYKSQNLFLEDKSSKDASNAEYYKNKVFELTQEYNKDKTELTQQLNKDKIEVVNKAKKPFIIALIIVSIMCVTLLTGFIYVLSHPKTITQEKQITKVITVENGKIKSILTK